jgi:hypothetical protein
MAASFAFDPEFQAKQVLALSTPTITINNTQRFPHQNNEQKGFSTTTRKFEIIPEFEPREQPD